MLNLLYQKHTIIHRLNLYFYEYFQFCSALTAEKLFLMTLAILTLESFRSVRFLYEHFLSKFSSHSLNSFYYVCSYAKIDYSKFAQITAKIALSLIPDHLQKQPIFLLIDDTLVEKYGTKFEECRKLFDHSAKNGSNYLNGHCFVSLMLCVPVKDRYLCIPLSYRLWDKKVSKLSLAATLVNQVMPVLKEKEVILLCDSWYPKGEVVSLIELHNNLGIICNVRVDSVMYALPPAPTGRRGRPKVQGKRLTLEEDFIFGEEKIGDYYVSTQKVLTNLFGKRVISAFVTTAEIGNYKKYRLFFSTIDTEEISLEEATLKESLCVPITEETKCYLPYFLYQIRWKIEVCFYETKTFWSMKEYMLRNRKGIEFFVNLLSIVYAAMKILPYQEKTFHSYQNKSAQETRFFISEQIREEIIIYGFLLKLENTINSSVFISLLKKYVFHRLTKTKNL